MSVDIEQPGHQPQPLGIDDFGGARLIKILPAGDNTTTANGDIFSHCGFAIVKHLGIFNQSVDLGHWRLVHIGFSFILLLLTIKGADRSRGSQSLTARDGSAAIDSRPTRDRRGHVTSLLRQLGFPINITPAQHSNYCCCNCHWAINSLLSSCQGWKSSRKNAL